jgi:hypothetical protein
MPLYQSLSKFFTKVSVRDLNKKEVSGTNYYRIFSGGIIIKFRIQGKHENILNQISLYALIIKYQT